MRVLLRHFVRTAGATVLLAGGLAAQAPPELAGFDRYVEGAMAEWEVPGLSIAVVKDGSVVLARGYGTRTLGRDEPVDENTVFAIGSATKGFTTAALGILADEGRLDWDDPVVDHLPWFRMWDPWVTANITLRDLVTHRSGLPGGRANLLWYASSYDRQEIVRRIRFLRPTAGFRAEYQYQNLMFLTAGLVVEAVSGTSWDDFVEARILRPLAMGRTVTSVRDLGAMENVASPHASIRGTWKALPWRNVDNVGPAGSINSSASDMAQWVRFHLGEGRVGSQHVMSASMIAEMGTPQFVVAPDRAGSMNVLNRAGAGIDFFTYGLGWQVFEYRGRKVMWHGGNIDGMAAVVAMMPGEELGLVILTNRNGGTVRDALMMRVFDAFTGAEERDWSRDLLAVEERLAVESTPSMEDRPLPTPGNEGPRRPMGDFAGVYEDDLLGTATLVPDGDGLVIELQTGLAGRVDWGPDGLRVVFDDEGLWATFASLQGAAVAFDSEADGRIRAMSVAGLGVFRRTDAIP